MDLVEAAARADPHPRQPGNQRDMATLPAPWDHQHQEAARSADYRVRGHAFRAIGQFRFRQKLELLRRGMEDESAAARGSALIALTSLSTDHPGDVNGYRPALNELAARDPNLAVRRLAIVCLRNGPPDRGTIQLLESLAQDDDTDRDVREAARAVAGVLVKKARAK